VSIIENVDRATALAEVVGVTEHIVSDWDLDLPAPLGPATRLVADLDFDSIDLVCLFVTLEQHHEGVAFSFEQLVMVDGEYVDDLTLAEVAGHVASRLQEA
jgi:acyl carrier protein